MPEKFHAALKAKADKLGLKGKARERYIFGALKKDTTTLQKHRRIKRRNPGLVIRKKGLRDAVRS